MKDAVGWRQVGLPSVDTWEGGYWPAGSCRLLHTQKGTASPAWLSSREGRPCHLPTSISLLIAKEGSVRRPALLSPEVLLQESR